MGRTKIKLNITSSYLSVRIASLETRDSNKLNFNEAEEIVNYIFYTKDLDIESTLISVTVALNSKKSEVLTYLLIEIKSKDIKYSLRFLAVSNLAIFVSKGMHL